MIYASALLHDIGRGAQYADGTPHEEAAVDLALPILADCGFMLWEAAEIVEAITAHRTGKSASDLGRLLYRADKMSQALFCLLRCEGVQLAGRAKEFFPGVLNCMNTMKIGNRTFQTVGHTYVMGILNVTPDSFSDGGRFNRMDAALAHVEQMCREGMDILDIGGESTRPGYTLLPDQQEIDRVMPVIEAVRARFDVPISLDTYKSAVAEAGLEAGADLINDIWGLEV